MDPLQKITESFEKGLVPKPTYDLIVKRFQIVLDGITRIEKASSIKFPTAYVDPSILVTENTNSFDVGVLYARTIPLVIDKSVSYTNLTLPTTPYV